MRGPGFFINAFKWFDFEYAVETLSDLGYGGLELWCKGQYFVPTREGEERVREMRELLDEHGLEIYSLAAHLDFISPNDDKREKSVERFEAVIEAAPMFDVEQVVTASGYFAGKKPSSGMRERFVDCMREVGECAEENGVQVVLEPEPEKYLRTPGQARDVIEEIGYDFGVCVDLSHAVALDLTVPDYLRATGDRLTHVHLDDAEYGVHPHEHLLPGEGDVDYGETFDCLEEMGFEGWVSAELNQHTEDPKHAASETYRFLEETGLMERFE